MQQGLFEPFASYIELMEFISEIPDAKVKKESAAHLLHNQSTSPLGRIKDILKHIVQEDYDENKNKLEFMMSRTPEKVKEQR